MLNNLLPPTTHKVKMHTSKRVNNIIKEKTLNNMNLYGGKNPEGVSARINSLNKEWDTERVLEANAGALMLVGSALALITEKKRWSVLTAAVGGFLLQHALQGWCPPLPIIRRLGVRTSSEIHGEKYYLKYVRGDFDKWRHK
ncbi:DUF2892 domain-containing protein [Clostridium sp. A1-XYC3]|uniref:DUF2892 domain-containing protein n=1 Tax=Clostridium tanneri TaxID=3037988 RepID=A0ABU4JNA5_9CLOT|nr:YgaP-like transmembrane domain [Clostridium sp. A1-XYC3]MDW8799633.1 DUF2892 domain-containing protein [Clostridium sp. A1-XYC3]